MVLDTVRANAYEGASPAGCEHSGQESAKMALDHSQARE